MKLSKSELEEFIKRITAIRNRTENETVEKFDKLINDLKIELEKL